MDVKEKRLSAYRKSLSPCRNHLSRLEAIDNEMFADRERVLLHTFIPVIVDFSEWVIESALKDNKKRLYFLARDAYLPYIVCKDIARKKNLNIDLRYLYVSRYSLRKAEYGLPGCDYLEKLCRNGINVTFDKVMDRADLNSTEKMDIARRTGYETRRHESLDRNSLQTVKALLSGIDEFSKLIRDKSDESLPKVLGYLAKEGMLDGTDYAIVDSGWVGSMQVTLKNLLSLNKLTGYYFGLYELPKGVNPDDYKTYFFAPYKDIDVKSKFSNCLFETICTAPHGMCTGYREAEVGGYRPEFKNKGNLNEDFIEKLEYLIKTYIKDFEYGEKTDKKTLSKPMIQLMSKPKEFEVAALGNLLFCDDIVESTVLPIANKLSRSERRKPFVVRSGWQEGSMVASSHVPTFRELEVNLYKRLSYYRKYTRYLQYKEET